MVNAALFDFNHSLHRGMKSDTPAVKAWTLHVHDGNYKAYCQRKHYSTTVFVI